MNKMRFISYVHSLFVGTNVRVGLGSSEKRRQNIDLSDSTIEHERVFLACRLVLTSVEAGTLSFRKLDITRKLQPTVCQSRCARQILLAPDCSLWTRHDPALLVCAALHEVARVVMGKVEVVVGEVFVRARVPAINQ